MKRDPLFLTEQDDGISLKQFFDEREPEYGEDLVDWVAKDIMKGLSEGTAGSSAYELVRRLSRHMRSEIMTDARPPTDRDARSLKRALEDYFEGRFETRLNNFLGDQISTDLHNVVKKWAKANLKAQLRRPGRSG